MLKFFGIFAVCFAIVQIGDALDCYNCAPPAHCENVENLTPIGCGNAAVPPLKPGCQKLTLRRKDTTEQTYLRRCIVANGVEDKSQCQAPLGFDLVDCNICFDDKCNSAETVRFSFVTVISILSALLFGRFVLS